MTTYCVGSAPHRNVELYVQDKNKQVYVLNIKSLVILLVYIFNSYMHNVCIQT